MVKLCSSFLPPRSRVFHALMLTVAVSWSLPLSAYCAFSFPETPVVPPRQERAEPAGSLQGSVRFDKSSSSLENEVNQVLQDTKSSNWQRYYDLGAQAYAQYKFDEAAKQFGEALRELKKTN